MSKLKADKKCTSNTYRPYFKISDTQTLQLINLYRGEEVLWNRNLENYKIRRLRDAAVNRIVQELNIAGLEPRHVAAKFRNIRDLYCKELRKILNSINSGDQVYKPSVFWFNQMDFVKPYLNSRDTIGDVVLHDGKDIEVNVENSQSDNFVKIEASEDNSYWSDFNNPELIIGSDKVENEYADASDNEYLSNRSGDCRSFIPNSMSTMKKQNMLNNEHVNINDTISEEITLNNVSAKQEVILHKLQEVSNRKGDSYDNFATYAASLLRELPKPKALGLQTKIIELIIAEHLKPNE